MKQVLKMTWARTVNTSLCFLIGFGYPTCIAANPPLAEEKSVVSEVVSAETTADLLNALDLTRPQLASVAIAWKRRDTVGTQEGLAQYFRTRTSIGWKTEGAPHVSPQNRIVADRAVGGELQGGLVPLIHSFPNRQIDWHLNATDHTAGVAHNDEWQWQLNRMSFWSDLALAYSATGDERYAQTFVQELRSWIVQCPVPSHTDNALGSSWRTIEAGIRSGGSWIDAFYAFRHSPALSDDDLLVFVHAFLEHGRYLRSYHTRLNWLTMEMSGLYAVGAVFPEFKEASSWRSYAATTLAEEGQKQFLPDGAQLELSTGYQNVALDNILKIAEIARWTGNSGELPIDYSAQLQKGYEWQAAIVAPDRYLPKINDSWSTYLPEVLRKASTIFPNQPVFQWFATNGLKGKPPAFKSVFLNRSGLAAMRSGWDTDANYLLFRVGPLGMGHQHQDSLGLTMWAYGRELIFNGGGEATKRANGDSGLLPPSRTIRWSWTIWRKPKP